MAKNARVRASIRELKTQQRKALRNKILQTARRIIRKDGFEGLSMRKLALELDCPPMTLYSFFKDKQTILTVLAREIFDELGRGIVGDEPGDPLLALREGCMRYIRFGLANPDEYRIIFMTPPATRRDEPISAEMLLQTNRPFAIHFARVKACVDRASIAGDAFAAAVMLWTTLHGVVSAAIALPSFPFGDVDAFGVRMVDVALRGLTSERIAPIDNTRAEAE